MRASTDARPKPPTRGYRKPAPTEARTSRMGRTKPLGAPAHGIGALKAQLVEPQVPTYHTIIVPSSATVHSFRHTLSLRNQASGPLSMTAPLNPRASARPPRHPTTTHPSWWRRG